MNMFTMPQFCFFSRKPKPPAAQIAHPTNPCWQQVFGFGNWLPSWTELS
jgi:hypothetical protein